MDSARIRRTDAPLQRAFASVALTALLIAFTALVVDCEIVVPPQGWNEKWGPLVPHETFPGDCGLCHVPQRWDVLRESFEFDHGKETGHVLRGAHAEAACLRCHNDRGPVQAYVARGCGGCHGDPHKGTLGLECTRCHDESSWRPGGLIAEHARTRFPLIGAHIAVPCEGCHERAPIGDFRGTPTQCEFCHQDEARSVSDPDHAAAGWIRDCDECHSPSGWGRAGIRHEFFPLRGGHAGLVCSECHTGGFSGVSPDCYSCHADDYQRAEGHVAGSYSTDCLQCHGRNSWEGADFEHESFPLEGGHSGLQCIRCHTSGSFGRIPDTCVSCHRDDYDGASDHAALQYPLTCEECHGIRNWDASFTHRFALRGDHDAACSRCHESSVRTFTCLLCHEHRKAKMDDVHKEERGYSYDSASCYECHPTGRD